MNEKRKERTKELYINATCELIRSKGMSAVTIRNISEEVGYNSATLYSYFENLSRLILCAQLRFEEELLEVMQKEAEDKEGVGLYEMWSHMYAVMAKYYLTHPNIFECMFVAEFPENKRDEIRESRGKESRFQQYVNENLMSIAKEMKQPIERVVKANMVCVAEVTGLVLLYSKARFDMKSIMDMQSFEKIIRQIIRAIMEEK